MAGDSLLQWRAVTADLVELVRSVESPRWGDTSACEGWTNKELLIHLAMGYAVRTAVLEHVIEDAPPSHVEADGANAVNVRRLRGASVDDIVAEMLATRARVEELVPRLSDQNLERTTQLAAGRPLREAMRQLSAHDVEHAEQLEQAAPPRY
jgi:hypothetical protein